jgi:hypothetical protein
MASVLVAPDVVWDVPMPTPTSGTGSMGGTSAGAIKAVMLVLILIRMLDLDMVEGVLAKRIWMKKADKGDLLIQEET